MAIGIKRTLLFVETMLCNAAGISIAFMAVSITLDVVARYGFKTPFVGIYTLTQNYLLVLIAFFAVAQTEREGLHVRITMAVKWLPRRIYRSIYIMANLVTAGYFYLVVWKGGSLALHAWRGHEVSSGIIPWPLYLGYAIVPVGGALIVVRLLYDCVWDPKELESGRG